MVLERIGNYLGSENQRLEERRNVLDYERRFIRKKKVNGKWVPWDTKTDAPPNLKAIQAAKNKLLTGSETPGKDKAYRGAEFRAKQQINDLRKPLLARLRRQFSPRTINEGERIIDVTRNEKEQKIKEQLAIKSAGTSHDQFLDPSSSVYKDGGREISEGYMLNGQWISTGTKGGIIPQTSDKNQNTSWSNKVSGGDPTTSVHSEAKPSEVNSTKNGSALKINNKDQNVDTQQNKDDLKIYRPKEGTAAWRIQQKLIESGFTQDELDLKAQQHAEWKANRK